MKNIHHHLAALAVTLWVGGLWVVGYLAVPTLFYAQPDRQLAGMLAGRMFEAMGYAGIVCGIYLLLYRWLTAGRQARDGMSLLIVAMLSIALLSQCYIQPLMADMKAQALPLEVMQSSWAGQFKLWHGISSILYLLESLLGAGLVILLYRASGK